MVPHQRVFNNHSVKFQNVVSKGLKGMVVAFKQRIVTRSDLSAASKFKCAVSEVRATMVQQTGLRN